jgi:hypothetical protein
MELGGLDLQSVAMIGGFFIAGFVVVWVVLGLRQDESPHRDRREDDPR